MRSMKIFAALFISMGCVLSSCSDDDNDGPKDPSEGAELSIPSSVVDGVRVQSDGSGINISYNADGSIEKATFNGIDYKFEYADSRAATSTGRKLVRISSYGDGFETEATNFKFNNDGFIESYTEKSEERDKYSGDYDKVTVKVKCSYNDDKRIRKMDLSSDTEEKYDGETEKYHQETTLNYKYSGGNLMESSVTGFDATNTVKYEYASNQVNTYNIITSQLAYGMANYSPMAYIFAITGYLGNASANLPSKMVSEYVDREDPSDIYSETHTVDIFYTFDDKHAIESITSNVDGMTYILQMSYFVQ